MPLHAASKHAVVVVESPTKADKIQRFLGDEFTVLASYGHVRDLPPRNGSVDPDHDFALQWQLTPKAGPRLKDIEEALLSRRGMGSSGGMKLVLATDPDREGEAISWHVAEELQARVHAQSMHPCTCTCMPVHTCCTFTESYAQPVKRRPTWPKRSWVNSVCTCACSWYPNRACEGGRRHHQPHA